MWAQILGMCIGLWLAISPIVLKIDGPVGNHSYVLGTVIAVIAYMAVWEVLRCVRILNIILAAALLIMPWMFPYHPLEALHYIFLGLCLLCLSCVEGKRRHVYGGGWLSLVEQDFRTRRNYEPH